MSQIRRTQKEIDDVLNRASQGIDSGRSKFWGMNYEEGLRAMYDWLTKDEPECDPMDD